MFSVVLSPFVFLAITFPPPNLFPHPSCHCILSLSAFSIPSVSLVILIFIHFTISDKRRLDEMGVEVGVKENVKKKLVRSMLKWTTHVDIIGDKHLAKRADAQKWNGKGRRRRLITRWEGCVMRYLGRVGGACNVVNRQHHRVLVCIDSLCGNAILIDQSNSNQSCLNHYGN